MWCCLWAACKFHKMLRLIIFFIFFASISTQLYDIATPGWMPAWVNTILYNITELADCIFRCKMVTRCVGGRYEFQNHECQLMIRSDQRHLMLYKHEETSSTAQTFGVHCSEGSGYNITYGFAIKGKNIEIIHKTSLQSCTIMCNNRFWCRSIDYNINGRCNLQAAGSENSVLVSITTFTFKQKNCWWERLGDHSRFSIEYVFCG